MKYCFRFFSSFLLLLWVSLYAQSTDAAKETREEDTISFIFPYVKMILIAEFKTTDEIRQDWINRHRKRPAKYIGIGVGASGFLSTKTGIHFSDETAIFNLDYSKSVQVQFNFFAYKFRLTNDFGLVTGMGFNFDHFVFQTKDKDFIFTSEGVIVQPLTSLDAQRDYFFKKHSLNTVDFHVPLLIDWAPIRERFRAAAGFTFAYLISKRIIRKYDDPEFGEMRQMRKYGLDFNSFQISVSAEIGYRFLSIYFDYGLVNLFRSAPYNQVHPFRLGLRINP